MKKVVEIGTQLWTAEPLRIDQFLNGDLIPEVRSNEEWMEASLNNSPAWCYYGNDSKYNFSFGKLYNRYVLMDERGIAPDGWRVPTYNDFKDLGSLIHQESLKSKVSSTPLTALGFTNLLGGKRILSGQFYNITEIGYFWSSTERDPTSGSGHSLKVVTDTFMGCETSGFINGEGHSIILIKSS